MYECKRMYWDLIKHTTNYWKFIGKMFIYNFFLNLILINEKISFAKCANQELYALYTLFFQKFDEICIVYVGF